MAIKIPTDQNSDQQKNKIFRESNQGPRAIYLLQDSILIYSKPKLLPGYFSTFAINSYYYGRADWLHFNS
jgi:hypothetical protein